MNRKFILQIFVVLLGGVIVGVVTLALFLVSLPILMARPQLAKPITDGLAQQFQKQMVGMMFKRRTSVPGNVG